MVQPATVSAVAGPLLCSITANPGRDRFRLVRASGHPIRLGRRSTVGVEPTMADLQSDQKPLKTRGKQGSGGSIQFYCNSIPTCDRSSQLGTRWPQLFAAKCKALVAMLAATKE